MEGAASVVTAILAVFTEVAEWLIGSLELIPKIFWTAENGLTMIGGIALIGGGIGLSIGLIRLIRGWFKTP